MTRVWIQQPANISFSRNNFTDKSHNFCYRNWLWPEIWLAIFALSYLLLCLQYFFSRQLWKNFGEQLAWELSEPIFLLNMQLVQIAWSFKQHAPCTVEIDLNSYKWTHLFHILSPRAKIKPSWYILFSLLSISIFRKLFIKCTSFCFFLSSFKNQFQVRCTYKLQEFIMGYFLSQNFIAGNRD